MAKFVYEPTSLRDVTRVVLDGKMMGFIKPERDGSGFFYTPKDSKHRGETFATADAVKRSLEREAA